MSDADAKDQGDRLAIREPVAKPLEMPDAQIARMSGHVEMSKVEKNRTNASDGSLRHYQPTNQADSLPADWEEQNTSLELQDGDISISRSNKLKETDLISSSSKNSKGKPYEVDTAEVSQEVRKLDSHKGDLNVAMAAAETLDQKAVIDLILAVVWKMNLLTMTLAQKQVRHFQNWLSTSVTAPEKLILI